MYQAGVGWSIEASEVRVTLKKYLFIFVVAYITCGTGSFPSGIGQTFPSKECV